MILIVGLGNPGIKYEKTRHNVGFRAIDKIAANFQFSIFNFQSIFNAEIFKKVLKNQKIILAKPQAFMNLSGIAVSSLMSFYKINPENLWVIHDDIDLPIGKIRISKNRGAGGHKGVQSIIKEIGTKDFQRIRIGICPFPLLDGEGSKPKNVEKFVIQKFNQNEEKIIKQVINDLLTSVFNKLIV